MNAMANGFNNFDWTVVTAEYVESACPSYRGNPLIESLPKPMTDEEICDFLLRLPEVTGDDRALPAAVRMALVPELLTCLVPLDRHYELARAVDGMIRMGYVGRAPRSAALAKTSQHIHALRSRGQSFRDVTDPRTVQISTALIGAPGIGKTTAVKAILSYYPQVIYHPALHLYQITHLIVEAPTDGRSMKGLCQAILSEVDRLIPGSGYYDKYTSKGSTTSDSLLTNTARILNVHQVGLLVIEEVQNLDRSNKGSYVVMAELTSMCNQLNMPILFVGTNKARELLTLDGRQARRSSGYPLSNWGLLSREASTGGNSEWVDFMSALLNVQYVRNPMTTDQAFLDRMYEYSQGSIDTAVKLFLAMQEMAISDQSETLTLSLIDRAFEKRMPLMAEPLKALRDRDARARARFTDYAPGPDDDGPRHRISAPQPGRPESLVAERATSLEQPAVTTRKVKRAKPSTADDHERPGVDPTDLFTEVTARSLGEALGDPASLF